MKDHAEQRAAQGRAKRSLGQNFLVDDNICRKIAAALEPGEADRILEIGPGRGAITRFLLEARPRRFLALEKDRDLARDLAERFPDLEVREADALKYAWEDLPAAEAWKLAGNLPYNIASPLIWEAVSRAAFDRAVFMVQLEVAQRICAGPGGRDYGALSAWVQNFARPRLLFRIGPGAFRPRPKVDSAVVLFRPLSEGDRPDDPQALADVLHLCFSKRRKQLGNILKSFMRPELEQWLAVSGVRVTDRPETLSPAQFRGLSLLVLRANPS